MIKILLIEDDLVDQKIFSRYVEVIEETVDIVICKTISESKTIVQSQSFDVIFCDYNLPDGSALNFLQNGLVSKGTPIIIVTGQADKKKEADLLDNGVFNFITKPLNKNELINTIAQFSQFKVSDSISDDDKIESLGFPNLTNLANGDVVFTKKIMNTIIRNLSAEVELFEKAARINNLEEIKHWPHKMRSTFTILGYDVLKDLSLKIESTETDMVEKMQFVTLLRKRIKELRLKNKSLNE